MMAAKVAPYGSWASPITSKQIASGTMRLGAIRLDGPDLYWLELRPWEGGRTVVVRRLPGGTIEDVTPAPFNVRTRVHEYGGGAYIVADGVVYFSNFDDQRLYRQRPGEEPQPLTADAPYRYADALLDRQHHRLICVREDHSQSDREAVNSIVALPLAGEMGVGQVLVAGNDFYSTPRLSPDGKWLAWLTWNHPNMPWDGTELWEAPVKESGHLGQGRRVAGGPSESIFQPAWSPDGVLHFASDRTGWWNLYRWLDGYVEPLCPMMAEFGLPQWTFDASTYEFASPHHIICAYTIEGSWYLARLHTTTGERQVLDLPFTTMLTPKVAQPPAGLGGHSRVYFLAGSPLESTLLVGYDLESGELETIRRSSNLQIDPGYLSQPRVIEYPTEGGLTAHAFFYPPQNQEYRAPVRELPPLLVFSHGGPTGATSGSLNAHIQFWTSRGFAVLDVNYGGSSGYGRAYRQRLNGQWGVVDVDDCVNGALYLAQAGLVDPNRLAIRGGSAGGYTTLAALTFRQVFQAGASYFGVSDLAALAQETHKFESRYLDSLVGPYPQEQERYWARSPLRHVEQLNCPIIFLQGLEDKVVPPNQAEMMVAALREKGLPVAYLPFEGEQHGFRRAETIERALEAEYTFYARIFGFEPAGEPAPLEIMNLE